MSQTVDVSRRKSRKTTQIGLAKALGKALRMQSSIIDLYPITKLLPKGFQSYTQSSDERSEINKTTMIKEMHTNECSLIFKDTECTADSNMSRYSNECVRK